MSEPAWVALGAQAVDYEGAYNAGTQYVPGDVVRYEGVDYICVNPALGTAPPAAAFGGLPVTPLVTALPASPFDGQEVILVDSLTAPTYTWRLRYVAAKASNKWVFVGGAPLAGDNVAAAGSSGSTTYYTPAGAITLVVPVAGLYVIELGFRAIAWTSAVPYMSYAIGATTAVDADAVRGGSQPTPGFEDNHSRRYRKTLSAAATLTEQHRVTGGNTNPSERFMSVTPVAVGG